MRYILFLSLVFFLSSCSINLSRQYDHKYVNLDSILNNRLLSLDFDTLISIRRTDCKPYSNDYLILIYKVDKLTKSEIFTSYGKFPKIRKQILFDWDTVLNSLNKIRTEKTVSSYSASVVEGDTTWVVNDDFLGDIWTFKLRANGDSLTWYSNSHEWYTNPSLTKSKVSKYLLSETYNLSKHYNSPYGEIEYKKLPIISFKR